jgi:hypothetical protein
VARARHPVNAAESLNAIFIRASLSWDSRVFYGESIAIVCAG